MSREGRTFDVVSEGILADAPDDDVAGAFEDWRKDLGDSEAPGKIQAYRIPLDEHGKASHSATGQIRLGSWPIDQYDFDSLCQIIMKEYMLPNERMMAVRLIGTLAGQKGVRFNKIVQLQRPNQQAVVTTGDKNGMADVMRAMQESNERIMKFMSEMNGARTTGGSGPDEMMRTVAMMRTLMEPMQAMFGPILAAAIGRPPAPTGPAGSMKETIETMMLLDRFMGRRGGDGGGKRSDFAEIASAVSGVAKPLLELAVANQQASAQQRKKPPIVQPPKQVTPPTPSPPPPLVAQAQPVVLPMDTPSPLKQTDMVGHDVSQPTPQPQENDAMFAEVKKQVDALVQVAANGSDPVGIADLFYDQSMMTLDDNGYGQLAALIEDDGFLTKISLVNGQVQNHADWFRKFREQLVKRIVEASDEPS